MSEGTISSESASETAKPEPISRPSGKGRNVWLMVVAIVIVIALVATAFVLMPEAEKERVLTATIKPDVLEVDAGSTTNLTVVVMLGDEDVTNNTATTTLFWSVTPSAVGSFSFKARWDVPFKAAIVAGTGTVKCSVEYRETPQSEVMTVVAEKPVTVLPPYLDAVSISPGAKTILPDGNWTFTATAVSSVGLPISGVDFTWAVTTDPGVTCTPNATTGSSVRLDVGSVEGNATLTATGSYAGKTKSGTSAIKVGYLPPRSMDYVWYDMFNVTIGPWYDARWPIYHQEEVVSYSDPSLFFYHSEPTGNQYLYTLMRLNITGRNVSEINTNVRPEFLPMLSPTERGGNIVIDWYMQYLTPTEIKTRYPGFAAQDDGWIIVLNGTTTMDKQAAKMVLNMTETGFETFDSWWASNSATVGEQYSKFLVDEASVRVDIENAYLFYLQLFTNPLKAEKVGDKIVLSYEMVSWGMEALIMRWLHESFLPVEMWYEDMNFHMTIGPEWADVDIDTAVTYALYATETIDSMGKTDVMPCWVFQGLLGDCVESSESHPKSDYDRYLPYSYLNRQPDSVLYGTYMQYDVVPTAWNLTENETLTFKWPDGPQLFRYRVAQGQAVNITEEMVVRYSEPNATDLPGLVSIDNVANEIEFIGPMNMYDWSKAQTAHKYLSDEWMRLGGNLLPYWMPWVEFEMENPVNIVFDHFEITMSDAVPANDDVTVTVEAINNYGFTHYGFNGTVNFTSSDGAALLPDNYTFDPATDQGMHAFDGEFKFQTVGPQTVTAHNASEQAPCVKTVTILPKRNASSMQVDVYYIPAVGVPEDVTVTVFDQYGDLFLNYTGTVTFSSDRPSDVTLPADYTFDISEAGVHTFPGEPGNLTFNAEGWFNITATDTVNSAANGTQGNIWVVASPEVIDHFTVVGIRDMLTRQKSDVTVSAYDQYGKLFKRYTGTIHFSANQSGGVFPADYMFTTSDEGVKLFKNGISFSSPGVFTVTVADTVVVTATGSQSNIVVEYRPASQTFYMYDFFQEPWHEWWPWRYKGYKTDIVLNNETGKYTMIYNADKRGNAGIIYAPYRWNMTGTNISQVSVHNPEFMPVLGTPDRAGAEASIDVYFQYLSWDWWNSYWKPVWNMDQSVMEAQSTDGWYPGVVYSVTMNRAAAEEWMGMPQTGNPLTWWAINGGNYLANWSAWIDYEGNQRLDIWAGFEWPYINAGTKMKLAVLPDGKIRLDIGHLGEGYEILMTRWFNETNLCNHEAYYEDMSLHVDFYDKWMDFNFDAVCQYSLRAVRANESSTNEPAWSWQPLLIDYVPSWLTPGGTHPSKFDPWANEIYQSYNAGDPSFLSFVPYDSGYANFSLTDYQTFIIQIPLGDDNIGYYSNETGIPVPLDAIKMILRGIPGVYDPWPRGDGTKYDYTAYWPLMCNGTMSLGWYGNWSGNPDLDSMYDPVTNRVTMVGPMVFGNTYMWNGALYFGAPVIEFNVTPVNGMLSLPSPQPQAPQSGFATEPAAATTVADMVSIASVVGALILVVASIAILARRKT